MDADTTANVHRTACPRLFTAVELVDYLRWAVAMLLAGAGVFIVARRLAGALETPLAPLQLLAAGILLAGLAWFAHAPERRGRLRIGNALITIAVLAIAASLSLWGSHPAALLAFWALVVSKEVWAWRGRLPAMHFTGPKVAKNPHRTPGPAKSPGEEREPGEPDADVLQQLTLRASAEGGQELSGWLRVPLTAGQRTGSLHVAFCPTFNDLPSVQAEPVSGPDCRIKAAQVLPYGARLDFKLDQPARQGESVLAWFHAASRHV
jgi:hypothetical protein